MLGYSLFCNVSDYRIMVGRMICCHCAIGSLLACRPTIDMGFAGFAAVVEADQHNGSVHCLQ